MRNARPQRTGKVLGRLADEIGLGDAREEVGERGDAARLRPAAGDPVDRRETGQRLGRGVGIGRLGIVDEEDAAAPADLLHAVRQAGEALQAPDDGLPVEAERAGHRHRRGGVLGIVGAAQRADAGKAGDPRRGAVGDRDDIGTGGIDAVGQRPAGGDAHDALAGTRHAVGDRLRRPVVDGDHRHVGIGDQALLDRGIGLEGAVAVEMVGREVEQHADRRVEARREIDLEGGALDHMETATARRLQREDRLADIAAERHLAAGGGDEMGDQRRGGRFAVGAGDGDERRVGTMAPPLAAEQLDIADDLDAGGARAGNRPVRHGMGERHARRQHQRGEALPVGNAQVDDRDAGGARRGNRIFIVVPGGNRRPAGDERQTRSRGRSRRGRRPRRCAR